VITVRSARPDERDDVRALLAEAYQQYAARMGPDAYARYLVGLLDVDEGRTLVAVDGAAIVGTARFYPPGHSPFDLPPDCAWVRAVAVRPSARGTGVATAIMAHCATNSGDATAIVLHTIDFMADAVRLYERLGYERAPRWDFTAGSGDWRAVAYRLSL
jgi:GNAT superfamily N-acetyltransferase